MLLILRGTGKQNEYNFSIIYLDCISLHLYFLLPLPEMGYLIPKPLSKFILTREKLDFRFPELIGRTEGL